MSDSPDLLRKLIQSIANTHDEEIDCGEAYRLLDEYTEAAARGDDLATLLPAVKQHLEMCRACCEEYEALLNIISNT